MFENSDSDIGSHEFTPRFRWFCRMCEKLLEGLWLGDPNDPCRIVETVCSVGMSRSWEKTLKIRKIMYAFLLVHRSCNVTDYERFWKLLTSERTQTQKKDSFLYNFLFQSLLLRSDTKTPISLKKILLTADTLSSVASQVVMFLFSKMFRILPVWETCTKLVRGGCCRTGNFLEETESIFRDGPSNSGCFRPDTDLEGWVVSLKTRYLI